MNPGYRIRITMKILSHKESRDREVVYVSYLDFAPYDGLTLDFTNDDKEHLEITLGAVKYSMADKEFVENQEDTGLLDGLRDSDNPECTVSKETMADYIASYETFGFVATPLINATAYFVRAQ